MYRIQAEHLSPDLVVDKKAREIYVWQLTHIKDHGRPATPKVLEDEFDHYGIEFTQPETVVDDLMERLRARYVRNIAQRRLKSLGKVAVNEPLTFAHELTNTARELSELVTKRGDSMTLKDHDLAIQHYHQKKLEGQGPSFGWEELDEHFYGQKAMSFLIASPGGYKSWSIINAAISNLREGRTVVLFPLELPVEDTDMRLRCMAADIPFWKWLKNRLDEDDERFMRKATDALEEQGGKLHIVQPDRYDRDAVSLMNRAIDLGAEVVFIDQLQQMVTTSGQSLGGENETGKFFETCAILSEYSKKIPVCVAHQFNRTVQGMDELPEMQQIKNSAAVEEWGTTVLGMWANRQMRKNNLFSMGVLKARNVSFKEWEVKVDLTAGCSFKIVEEV